MTAKRRVRFSVPRDHQAPPRPALEQARAAAFPAGEYVGQESFMRAGELRSLAHQARIGPGVSVLDLCCGAAGPGRMITAESGCRYLGVDHSASALATARERAGDLPCRFEQAHLPPLPQGSFEVVLLLETMLAFPDKEALVREVDRVLEPGGRFAFTVEEGRPLTEQERARMPAADTVWPVGLAELTGVLRGAGLTVIWQQEYSSSHHAIAAALHRCYRAESSLIAAQIGAQATDDLITAHQLWSDWLGSGRVRKFAIVAEKPRTSPAVSATFDYARYLAAKTTVDDRALNQHVLAGLRRLMPAGAPRILEVGAGLGTMVARLLDWGAVTAGEYVLLDADRQLLDASRQWLSGWAAARGLRCDPVADGLLVGDLRVRLVHAELGSYVDDAREAPADVLIANAVLDLVDVPAVLPGLLRLLVPGGVYWFTINYDGESVFAPDHPHDGQVMHAYHQDMNQRFRYGRPAGESRTGRHLFHHLRAAGAPALAAGSSDWVVHPGPDGAYPGDEAYFVRSILDTIGGALRDQPDRVEPADLAEWLAERGDQLAAGELVYIAHQLDYVGRSPG
jgi:SAM-dependent methyltransferase